MNTFVTVAHTLLKCPVLCLILGVGCLFAASECERKRQTCLKQAEMLEAQFAQKSTLTRWWGSLSSSDDLLWDAERNRYGAKQTWPVLHNMFMCAAPVFLVWSFIGFWMKPKALPSKKAKSRKETRPTVIRVIARRPEPPPLPPPTVIEGSFTQLPSKDCLPMRWRDAP